MNSELEQYLESAAAQGFFQDEGNFRIQAEKALEKLSRFALPGPGLWVLKMVQAAVRLGVGQIDFTFQRRQVVVTFENRRNWDAEALLAQLLSAKLPDEPACRHLFAGILGAALGFTQEIEWSCGKSRVVVGKNGPVVTSQNDLCEFKLTARRPSRPAITSGLLTSPIRYLLRQTVQEYKALIDQTTVAPITVRIDQRLLVASYQTDINQLPSKPGYDSDKSSGRLVMLAQIPLSGLQRPCLAYPIDETPLTTLDQPADTFETLRLEPEPLQPVQGVVCLYSCLQRESRLNLVMDGVCLQRNLLYEDSQLMELKFALEDGKDDFVLDIYLEVSFQELDISHFSVRTRSFSQAVMLGVPKLRQVLSTLRGQCRLRWEMSKKPPAREGSNLLSVSDIAGAGFLSLFIPHAVVLAGVFGTGYVAVKAIQATGIGADWWQKFQQNSHNEKAKALEERLDSVIQALGSVS